MTLSILNNFSNYDNNSKFLISVILIISVLLVLIFIFNYLSNRQIRRQKKLSRLISKEARDIVPLKKEVKKEDIKEVKKEKIIDEPITINKTISTISSEPLMKEEEEIIEVLQDENESDIDRILREIKDATIEETFNLTEFEREQEESAIISYDELCKRAGVKKKIYKTTKETEEVPVKSENKKYKPTEFVSPIYGIQNKKKENVSYDENDLDQTFLQSLKEFKSTLE